MLYEVITVVGRGKQRGIKIGDVTYDELPKEMLIMVIKDEDKDFAISTIMEAARTEPKGAFGDGKIFVTVITSYSIHYTKLYDGTKSSILTILFTMY